MFDTQDIAALERGKLLIQQARCLIMEEYPVYDADDACLYLRCNAFYLDIEFDFEQPIIIFCINRAIDRPITRNDLRRLNELNLGNPLGQHALHEEFQHYLYRRSHLMETPLTPEVLEEIISHCYIEALRGYGSLTAGQRGSYSPRPGRA